MLFTKVTLYSVDMVEVNGSRTVRELSDSSHRYVHVFMTVKIIKTSETFVKTFEGCFLSTSSLLYGLRFSSGYYFLFLKSLVIEEIAYELPKDLHKNCWLQSMLATRWGFAPSCNKDGTYSSKQCHQKR